LRRPFSSSFVRYAEEEEKKVRGPVIGIDLGKSFWRDWSQNFDRMLTSFPSGTTNSAVAIMEGQNAKIIENSEGEHRSLMHLL
jgi:molecular chaperone DnaK